MSSVQARPFAGTYHAQPAASTCGFAVRHFGAYRLRGALTDVTATLRDSGDGPVLEGSARVESISLLEPAALRESVLGPAFFDLERHPELGFQSTAIRLLDDGQAEVDGRLTMRGVTCPVTARGEYAAPRQSGFAEVAGLRLQATIDRRMWGLEWQTQLPDGGDAVGWDVELEIDLLLISEAAS